MSTNEREKILCAIIGLTTGFVFGFFLGNIVGKIMTLHLLGL